jgi:asparagine synthase (glutamine-hydrolysing)
MCGISGIISPAAFESDHLIAIREMAKIQNHRGPDSTGFAEYPHVLFAHNRLSLIDLHERSNQPFTNDRYSLIYNGEIYNFRELREELVREFRIEFIGTSDTEVLFYGLIHWGAEITLQRIQGMFAFAFYDTFSQNLVIARDKIGIKPLFYFEKNGTLYFASELKALTAIHPALEVHRPRLMQAALGALEYSRRFTGFQDIHQLEPGHFISTSTKRTLEIYQRPYFKTADWIDESEWQRLNKMTDHEADLEFERLLTNSVKSILISDAGMGAFVSGGIDSSIIAAIARQNRNISLYSSNVVGKFSEIEYARLLAEHIKGDIYVNDFNHEYFIRDWIKTTWHYENPLVVHPSAVPFQNIASLTRQNGDKAVITGEGSDELFLGYPRLLTRRYNGLIQFPLKTIHSVYKKIPGLTRYLNLNQTDYFGDAGRMSFDYERKLKEKEYRNRFSFLEKTPHFEEQLLSPSMIDNGLHSLLWRNDRMGMMHSIESRFPFLDDPVMKFGVNLPVKFKIGRTAKFHNWKHPFLIDKAIVRRLGARYLPDRLVNKKKDGFPMYGQMYMKVDKGFFMDGFWQQQMEMTPKAVEYMCDTIEPYLLAKLASVEIWGRLFVWKQPQALVDEHAHQYSRMEIR